MILLRRPAFFGDLDHYVAHIAKDNPDAAKRLLAAAEETAKMLLRHPEIGHQESFRKQQGIRSWRVNGFDNYLIFYRINPDSVELLRLLNGARDLPKFFPAPE